MSKASFNEVAQRPNERREVDLFRLNGFESYYKFTREKGLTYAALGVVLNIRHVPSCKTLTLLLVNCHDVTGGIFDR